MWATAFSYLQVKDTKLHGVGRLAVGQEGQVVEDAAHGAVGGRRFGLGGQRRGVRVYGPVQVSEHTNGTWRLINRLTKQIEDHYYHHHHPAILWLKFIHLPVIKLPLSVQLNSKN